MAPIWPGRTWRDSIEEHCEDGAMPRLGDYSARTRAALIGSMLIRMESRVRDEPHNRTVRTRYLARQPGLLAPAIASLQV